MSLVTWIAQIIWLNADWPIPIPENPAWFLVCRFGQFRESRVVVPWRVTWLGEVRFPRLIVDRHFFRTTDCRANGLGGSIMFPRVYISRKLEHRQNCRPPPNTNVWCPFHREVCIFWVSWLSVSGALSGSRVLCWALDCFSLSLVEIVNNVWLDSNSLRSVSYPLRFWLDSLKYLWNPLFGEFDCLILSSRFHIVRVEHL